jgi:hypothetical protein
MQATNVFKVGDRVHVETGTCLLNLGQDYTVERANIRDEQPRVWVRVRCGDGTTSLLDYPEAWFSLAKAQPTVASDLKLTPQARTVLSHLKKRSISPMEAMITYGISRLASCIHEIRKRAGYDVETVVKHDEHGHKYARYSLANAATVH